MQCVQCVASHLSLVRETRARGGLPGCLSLIRLASLCCVVCGAAPGENPSGVRQRQRQENLSGRHREGMVHTHAIPDAGRLCYRVRPLCRPAMFIAQALLQRVPGTPSERCMSERLCLKLPHVLLWHVSSRLAVATRPASEVNATSAMARNAWLNPPALSCNVCARVRVTWLV